MCILTAWLKTSHPMCLCSAHSFHLHAIHDVCLIVCWLRPRSVLLLFLSVVYLFSSTLYLHSDQHFLSNVNSVEGINHCAFAQRGKMHHGEKPSSHKEEWIHWVTTIWCAKLFLCLKQWKYQMQKQQRIQNGKTRENTGMAADESQKPKRGDRWSKKWGQNRKLCTVDGRLSSQEIRS